MAVGFDVWVIGLLNGMVGYSVMAERKEREKQRSVWRRERERERERKWGEKERGLSNGNKTGTHMNSVRI